MKLDIEKVKEKVKVPTESKIVMCCYGANCDEVFNKDFDHYSEFIGEAGQLGENFDPGEPCYMNFEKICQEFDLMDRFVMPMGDRERITGGDWELHDVKLLPCGSYYTMPVVKFVCRITNEKIQHKFMQHSYTRMMMPPDFIVYMYIPEPVLKGMNEKTIKKFRKLAWGVHKAYRRLRVPVRDFNKEQEIPKIVARLKINI